MVPPWMSLNGGKCFRAYSTPCVLLLVIYYLLFIIYFLLFIIYYLLFIIYFLFFYDLLFVFIRKGNGGKEEGMGMKFKLKIFINLF